MKPNKLLARLVPVELGMFDLYLAESGNMKNPCWKPGKKGPLISVLVNLFSRPDTIESIKISITYKKKSPPCGTKNCTSTSKPEVSATAT